MNRTHITLLVLVVALALLTLSIRRMRRGVHSPQRPAGSSPQNSVYHGLERALSGVAASLEQTFRAEEYAGRSGLLQQLDTRTKIITCLAFLIAAALSRNLPILAGLSALALVLAWFSKLPMGMLLRRVWLVVFLFTAVIALPATLSIFTPGKDLLVLFDLKTSPAFGGYHLPQHVSITEQGATSAAFLILRVSTSVSFALLLVLTTPWTGLLRGLSVLGVPKMAVFMLGMTHRYIYVLLNSVTAMFVARKSRTVGPLTPAQTRGWLTSSMGVMLGRSFHLSSEVHLAMLSRGFTGEVRMMEASRMKVADFVYLPLALLVATAAGAAGLMLPLFW